jgi:hypothetical protein
MHPAIFFYAISRAIKRLGQTREGQGLLLILFVGLVIVASYIVIPDIVTRIREEGVVRVFRESKLCKAVLFVIVFFLFLFLTWLIFADKT